MKTNEERLESLRENTSKLLSLLDECTNADLIKEVCDDFIGLDISLLDGGALPGAWGASKMSKSKMS